jgi:hypothetical protein
MSGGRRQRMVVGGFFTVLVGLPGLVLVVGSVVAGLNERGDWIGVGMGCSFLSLSYGFGRLALAAYTENGPRPIGEGSAMPYKAAAVFLILGLAAAFHGSPS